MKTEEELNKRICKNCGQTYDNHPLFNPLTKRWSKSHITGQHRLRSIHFMCKEFIEEKQK